MRDQLRSTGLNTRSNPLGGEAGGELVKLPPKHLVSTCWAAQGALFSELTMRASRPACEGLNRLGRGGESTGRVSDRLRGAEVAGLARLVGGRPLTGLGGRERSLRHADSGGRAMFSSRRRRWPPALVGVSLLVLLLPAGSYLTRQAGLHQLFAPLLDA
jgi:hypothetical protein